MAGRVQLLVLKRGFRSSKVDLDYKREKFYASVKYVAPQRSTT